MNIYYSKQGETLDYICHLYYGNQSGVVEKVLDVNYGLSELPEVLPTATKILLPDIDVKPKNESTELF